METNEKRPANYENLRTIGAAGLLSPDEYRAAKKAAGILPALDAWREFLNYLLIISGSVLFLCGVIFFFAYNWQDLSRFAKFGIVQGLICLSCAGAWYSGSEKLVGKAALLGAVVLTGPLLAVFGQVYQTGADSYQLFLGWVAFITPWVLLNRFSGTWLVFWVLVNTTIMLYWNQEGVGPERIHSLHYSLYLFNLLSLFLWEFGLFKKVTWMPRWLVSLFSIALMIGFAWPLMAIIVNISKEYSDPTFSFVTTILYLLYTACILVYHTLVRRDLLSQAVNILGVIVLLTTFVGERVLNGFEHIFVLGCFVIVQTIIAIAWFRFLVTPPTREESQNV